MRSALVFFVALPIALVTTGTLTGCGDDSSSGGGGAGGEAGTGGIGTEGPINAPEGEWTWVPFPGTQCMDGSETGFAINRHGANDDVVIFLEGGNACFNFGSCASTANLDGYDAEKFAAQARTTSGNTRTSIARTPTIRTRT